MLGHWILRLCDVLTGRVVYPWQIDEIEERLKAVHARLQAVLVKQAHRKKRKKPSS